MEVRSGTIWLILRNTETVLRGWFGFTFVFQPDALNKGWWRWFVSHPLISSIAVGVSKIRLSRVFRLSCAASMHVSVKQSPQTSWFPRHRQDVCIAGWPFSFHPRNEHELLKRVCVCVGMCARTPVQRATRNAASAGMLLVEVIPFVPGEFPGYNPRREAGNRGRDRRFEVDGALTHVFVKHMPSNLPAQVCPPVAFLLLERGLLPKPLSSSPV